MEIATLAYFSYSHSSITYGNFLYCSRNLPTGLNVSDQTLKKFTILLWHVYDNVINNNIIFFDETSNTRNINSRTTTEMN